MEKIEHELERMEMILDEDMTQNLWKELKDLNEKNREENDNLCHEWNWKHLSKEGLNRVVEKINNEKNKLAVVL